MSKTDLSFNGLVGVMEAMLEAAKRFQEFEERYLANESSFQQIRQQFQQMQDGGAQLQSIAEERLASLSSLNVELKARHAQGEQVLAEVREILGQAKAAQGGIEQALAAGDGRHQLEAERNTQLAQTVGVLQTLVDKLQSRQSQIEQSLLAVESLVKDQNKRQAGADELAKRQDQVEKSVATVAATQQAEKGLMAHFEKSLTNLKSRVGELENRPAAPPPSPDPGPAVADLAAQMDQLRQAVQQSAEEAAKAAVAAAVGAATVNPQDAEAFQKFLVRCEADYKAALERENKLSAQWRKALDTLPARAEAGIQKLLEQSQSKLDQSLASWRQQLERRAAEAEQGEDGALHKLAENQRHIEGELATLAAAKASPVSPEWIQAVEAASAVHSSELRFLKTLMWITLAAVGLSYGLVAYAVILRS